MSNEAFDIWLKENYLVDMSEFIVDEQERTYIKENNLLRKAWQAAKAGSEQEIAELKANINDLRDALNQISFYSEIDWIQDNIEQVLEKTPAQSLQEHDNEVIENCAIVCENIITGDDAEFYTDAFAKAIREMKGK